MPQVKVEVNEDTLREAITFYRTSAQEALKKAIEDGIRKKKGAGTELSGILDEIRASFEANLDKLNKELSKQLKQVEKELKKAVEGKVERELRAIKQELERKLEKELSKRLEERFKGGIEERINYLENDMAAFDSFREGMKTEILKLKKTVASANGYTARVRKELLSKLQALEMWTKKELKEIREALEAFREVEEKETIETTQVSSNVHTPNNWLKGAGWIELDTVKRQVVYLEGKLKELAKSVEENADAITILKEAVNSLFDDLDKLGIDGLTSKERELIEVALDYAKELLRKRENKKGDKAGD